MARKRPQKTPIKGLNPVTTSYNLRPPNNAETIVRTKREISRTFAHITLIEGTFTQGRFC